MREGAPRVLLAIPAYNCRPQIGRVLAAVDDPLLARVDRIVVIDNCSTDGTAEAAAEAGARLGERFEVWRNVENYGLGGSHKVAFDAGVRLGMDYVAILHGDDQAAAPDLHRLIDVAAHDRSAAAVLGSRFSRGSVRTGYSRTRTVGNLAINAAYTLMTRRRTVDLGSGLNLFAMDGLADGFYRGLDDRITFNIDLLLSYYSRRARLRTVPISWRELDQVSNARNVSVGTTAMKRLVAWRFGLVTSRALRDAYPSEVVA